MELIAEKEVEFRSRMAGRPYIPPKPIARGLSGMGSFGLASMGFQPASSRMGGGPRGVTNPMTNQPPTTVPGARPMADARPLGGIGNNGVGVGSGNGGIVPLRANGPVAAAGATAELAGEQNGIREH